MGRIPRILFVAALVALLGVSTAQLLCSDPNQPVHWFNSSTQVARMQSGSFNVWPLMPNGTVFWNANATYSLLQLSEIATVPNASTPSGSNCQLPSQPIAADITLTDILRSVVLAEGALCVSSLTSLLVAPGTLVETWNTSVTLPDWPSFHLDILIEQTNASYNQTVPASEYTWGKAFTLKWEVSLPKFTVFISNWNWTDTPINGSALTLFVDLNRTSVYPATRSQSLPSAIRILTLPPFALRSDHPRALQC